MGSYPWVFTVGVLCALLWLAWSGPARGARRRLDSGLVALAGGLVGARLGYVLTHLGYFSGHGLEALYLWQGGLAWSGGAIGAAAGLAAFARVRREAFWDLADGLAVPAAMVGVASWIGCALDRCAYGRRTEPAWWAPPSADLFGALAPRWPTQVIGAVLSLATVAVLVWLSTRRLAPGVMAALSVASIAATALGLAFLRGDPVPAAIGLRLEAVFAGAILAVAVAALGLRMRGTETPP